MALTWKDGAFRIDPLWFVHNSEDYIDLYQPIWILLHTKQIPFRLHWGKIFQEWMIKKNTIGERLS